jgi:hypothetical protein
VTRYGWLSKSYLANPPVLVIVCTDAGDTGGPECLSECIRPMLMFNPDSTPIFVQTEVDRTMDPCCGADPCLGAEDCLVSSEAIAPWWIAPFVILGKGDCLNETSFDEPSTGECYFPFPYRDPALGTGFPPNGFIDFVDFGGINNQPCSPLERIDSGKICRDEAYMIKNGLYCSWLVNTTVEPCVTDLYFCPWNPWCETTNEFRTWTWNAVVGGT